MSQPSSPSLARSPSTSSVSSPTTAENVMSYKKPLRIRNQRSEQRRNALKEYYKLKEQQRRQQEDVLESANTTLNAEDEDDSTLEDEITENKPIEEIDLMGAEFKDVLSETNRLSSSINLINSTIKNIIYNNYYELIKLNDFLDDLKDLNISKLMEQESKDKKDVLGFLNSKEQKTSSRESSPTATDDIHGFDHLRSLMEKIQKFDKTDYKKTPASHKIDTSGITTLLTIQDNLALEIEEDKKAVLNEKVTKWIEQLQTKDNTESLVRQLQDIKRALQPTSS